MMSKERELLEKWVSQFGNLRHDFNLLTETKELLAQPEQEPVVWQVIGIAGFMYVYNKPRDQVYEHHTVNALYLAPPQPKPLSNEQKRLEAIAIKQPEQEPVATKLESHQFTAFHVSADDFKKLQKLPTGTKIYTAPPTREPLSDDEMRAIWKEGIRGEIPFVEIGRAIEKAHGITGVDDES